MILQIIFGLTHGSLLEHLVAVLKADDCQSASAGLMKIPLFDYLLQPKPLYFHRWEAMDGLKLALQRPGKERQQNNFYNGWTHEHYVTNVFLSSPDGKIRCSYFNASGVLHNSTIAIWSSIYDKIEMVYRDTGKRVVVDSAFASKKSNAMLKSHQNNVDANGSNPQQRFGIDCQATSDSQAVV